MPSLLHYAVTLGPYAAALFSTIAVTAAVQFVRYRALIARALRENFSLERLRSEPAFRLELGHHGLGQRQAFRLYELELRKRERLFRNLSVASAATTAFFVAVTAIASAATQASSPQAHSLNKAMDDELQQAWKELADGRIAYEPSQTMTVGDSKDVLVRVARGERIDVRSGFHQRAWTEHIKVSGSMAAMLSGRAEEFSIEPLSTETQATRRGGY